MFTGNRCLVNILFLLLQLQTLYAIEDNNVVVGKIADSYEVSSCGQFTYSIPIAVATGTGGMMPNLSITYNSSNHNGLFGYGFDLQGLSIISRAPRNLFNDGYADIIRFNSSDRFTIDGQRLQRVDSTETIVEYRTESDTYARILSYGDCANPDSFVVFGKNGIKYKYISYANNTSLCWHLSQVTDTKSNYYTITYRSISTHEVVPIRIDYTGNIKANLQPFATVLFNYTSIDSTPSYISGAAIKRTSFISSINVICDGVSVRRFAIAYSQKNNRLFLSSITESTPTQHKRPTTFTWDNSDAINIEDTEYADARFKDKAVVTGDFNGDGKTDFLTRANNDTKNYNFLIYLSKGNSFAEPQAWHYIIPTQGSSSTRIGEIRSGDFNGDGYDDFIVERPSSMYYYLDYWETCVSDDNQEVTIVYKKTISAPFTFNHTLHVIDANCDGAADLFINNTNYFSTSYYSLLSSSTDSCITPLVMGYSGNLTNDCWDSPGCVELVDIDGDGTNEILNVKDEKNSNGLGSILYALSPITGELTYITGLTLGGKDNFLTGDFNGDGKTDILQMGDDKTTKWTMNISRGILGAARKFQSFDLQDSPFSLEDKSAIVVDLNGDGKDDMFVVDKESSLPMSMYINDGNATGFVLSTSINSVSAKDRLFNAADFNGDGKMELIHYAKPRNGTIGYDIVRNTNTSTYLLTDIMDGLGNNTHIQYSRLSQNDAFTRGTQTAYPVVSVGCQWNIVSRVFTPDGIGGTRVTEYHYTDALFHKRGRGMLGFRKIKVTDANTGKNTIREYEVIQPVVTLVLKSETSNIDNVTVSETRFGNTLSFKHNSNNNMEWVYSCMPTNTQATTYEYNTGIVLSHIETRTQYDYYGNAKSIVVLDGTKTTVTENIYYNDTAKWELGRLMQSRLRKQCSNQSISHVSAFRYDNAGMLIQEKFDPGMPHGYTKDYTYDVFGNVIMDIVVPSDGSVPRRNLTAYDKRGRYKISSENTLGHKTEYLLNEKLGVVTSTKDANGLITNYTYDSFGNLKSEISPLKTVKYSTGWNRGASQAPTMLGYYMTVEETGQPTTTIFYDQLGRERRKVEVSGNGNSYLYTETVYDNCGRVTAVSEPHFQDYQALYNSSAYDRAGRVISNKNALGYTTRYVYDGLTTTVIDPNGGSQSKTFDTNGRLVESIDALGNSITYAYDINDNCITTTGPTSTIETEFDNYGYRTKLIDPDLGEISYNYNGYGELVSQTDSHGTSDFEYDGLGRLVKETRPDFTYSYVYDTKLKGAMSCKSCSNSTSIDYSYDSYGRIVGQTHKISNRTFNTRTSYNTINRPDTVTYPSGFKIKLRYFDSGYLQSITNAATGDPIWEAVSYDERGNNSLAQLGNGLLAGVGYNLDGTISEVDVGDLLLCWYEYDGCKNLTCKLDDIGCNEEYYSYDALNRLTSVTTVSNGTAEKTIDVEYDAGGNITSKTGIGSMTYEEGTNRLMSIEGYELPEWESIKYTSFNKISEVIATRNDTRYFYTMVYGPDKTRCRQGLYPPGSPGTKYDEKYYVGNIYDEALNNGKILAQDYIYANGKLVAIHQNNQGVEKMKYVHLDHLGSVWAITDENGDIEQQFNYDPWGRKRNPETWDYYTSYEHLTNADRGFGGHEQMDIMDMVNMEGRMYDPYMGRFLSPDPYIQAPDYTQSLNRYAYCINNPLSYTDPTGYSWLGNFFSSAIGIAVAIETGGFGGTIWGVMASAACGGAAASMASSMMNGANLWTTTKSAFTGGFWGALGGMANFGIGSLGRDWYTRMALHSISDGTMEALQGGHFEHGLYVGMVSAGGNELISGYANHMTDVGTIATSAVLGGVVSEIGGGKFANGAMTSAFQMMYNFYMHRGPNYKQLGAIDEVYRQSLSDYATPQEFFRSLGLPEYANGCAARMCYALQESGVLMIPEVNGQTLKGNDGRNYFMFAKDLRNYFYKKWGIPRVYNYVKNPNINLQNGVVSQSGFEGAITGHVEYFYKGHDGHWRPWKNKDNGGSLEYYESGARTELWKCGFK